MRISNDIETALYERLAADSISASAHAIPATLGKTLPHVHVVRTGGFTSNLVLETNNVDFDVYAETAADAMTAASELCAWVRDLEGSTVGTACYTSEVITLPYGNPDPRHPTLGRATFKVELATRIKEG